MPAINVVYWNLQDFGKAGIYKNDYTALSRYVANAAMLAEADVICVMELKSRAVTNRYINSLYRQLCNLPEPWDNWYFDWIKGAIKSSATAPYADAADLDWDSAHYEGYVMFWNQNLAKFKVESAHPIHPPAGGGAVANTQSETVHALRFYSGIDTWGYGVALAANITVPIGPGSFILPTGTTAPAGVAITNAGGAVVIPAGTASAAPIAVNAGTVLPTGTIIGAGGVTMSNVVYNIHPTVIPGAFTLTDPCTLPAVGTTVVPQHTLSLTLTGRDTYGDSTNGDISHIVDDFTPGGPNKWTYLKFTRGAGFPAVMSGARRPAYFTIKVNRNLVPPVGAADYLVPITMYHAPSRAPASSSGMQRSSYCRQMYQVYDAGAGAWIDSDFSVLGGDVNVRLQDVAYAYNAFTNAFGAMAGGGADCEIQVFHGPLGPPPATRADNPLNKTTVQLKNPIVTGPPVVSANRDDYRRLAIDNVFFRGFTAAQSPAPPQDFVYNQLDAVTANAAAYNISGAVLTNFVNAIPILNTHNAIMGGAPGPGSATPNIQDVVAFINGLNAGSFNAAPVAPPAVQEARKAAELINLFISDHQPVIFSMNL